jgi:hypothetical protein
MLRRLSTAVESGPSTQVVRVLIELVRDGLRASDYRAGCAVAAVTLDATPADGVLLGLTAEAFAAWRGVLAGAFRRDGATGARARRLAAFVCGVEGALMQRALTGT